MNNNEKVRKPTVDGMFYPGNAKRLKSDIQHYLKEVKDLSVSPEKLYGLIAPHAGYPYSGPVAAFGYQLLKNYSFEHVVIIAPSHREFLDGFSVYPGDYYETPLGQVPLDTPLRDTLVDSTASISSSVAGHRSEHSLEVQLPFLQVVLEQEFKLLPIIMGQANLDQIEILAKGLNELSNQAEFVVIASSDLSHYHPYNEAVKKDKNLIKALEAYDLQRLKKGFSTQALEACGLGPILTMLLYAHLRGQPACKALDYRNSGDTSGMKDQVVGYVSAAVFEK